MSRHQLTPKPAYPNHTIVIGWDRPLRTFYVQVMDFNAPDDETIGHATDNPYIWLGCEAEEITNAADAADRVRPYAAEIPPGLIAQLKSEQAAEPGRGVQVWQMCNHPTDL